MAGRPDAELGLFGGSGFYSFLEGATDVAIQTPYGPPSDRVAVGEVAGRRIAFLPRHGRNHDIPPHRINYRANLWAMRELGVTRILAPCAVGSLSRDIAPGTFVVCDQIVDRTWGRADTYFDGPLLNSITFADPYVHGRLVTHRVIRIFHTKHGLAYRTKGDANATRDPWTIRLGGRVGRTSFSVPYAGYALWYLHTREVRSGLILVAALLLLTWMLRRIWRTESAPVGS